VKVFISIALLLLTAGAFAQQKPAARTDLIVNVNGRAVHIRNEGSKPPVVVFEAGMGDTLETWAPVFPEVAKFAHAFAYDRAGSGQSGNVSGERSYKQLAVELHEVLQGQKLAPPYVLVGHSFGAVVSRAFYAAYPTEVSAIVLIDPMTEILLGSPSATKTEPDERLKTAPPGVHSEFAFLNKDLNDNFRAMSALGRPKVPITLLVARSVRPAGWEKAVLDRYEDWILERDDSSIIVTSNSAHFIHRDEPELVIGAIRRIVYPNPLPELRRTLRDKGIDAAVALFRDQVARYPKQDMNAGILNGIGYEELEAGHVDNAIRLFALNVEANPKDPNVYDSLGEAYAVKGDRENAIANYKKSLDLNPKNVGALEAIARLKTAARR